MDTNTISAAAQMVTQVGFPVAVSAYLLIRFQRSIDSLTAQISRLTQLIQDERWK